MTQVTVRPAAKPTESGPALRRARARLARAAPAQEDRADVELEMPPIATWFTGQRAVTGFLAARVMRPGRWRLQPSSANTQPAVIVHRHGGAGSWEPYGVQVLTLTGARVARIVSFNDPGLVPSFAAAPATTTDNRGAGKDRAGPPA